MPNDSTTGGYLQPTGGNPLDDQALDRVFHDLIMNLTGLSAESVLPRWQEEPPNMPANGQPWIAQGVTDRKDDAVVWEGNDPDTGIFTVCRNQSLDNLISFYGPTASTLEALFRDNLAVAQNRDVIVGLGINLVRVGDPRNMSVKINERWQKRIDVTATFRRLIWRTYPVLTILSVPVSIETDTGFTVTETA
ncbi:MAG: hypothetical protein VST70_01665 [Nitrospirota bacterium]|nr:hypothetical protein [Nitrospirota bacterium]